MKKLGIISSILIIISVFLPWFSSSVSGSGTLINTTVNSPSFSGLLTNYGLLGILLGGVSIFLFFKENKWSFIPGLLSIIDGILFILYLNGFGVSSSSSFGEYSQTYNSSLEPQIGVYLLIIGGLLSVIFGIRYFIPKREKTHESESKKNKGISPKNKRISTSEVLKILPYILVSVYLFLPSVQEKSDFIGDNEDVIIFTILILIIISSIVSGFLNFKYGNKLYLKVIKTLPLLFIMGMIIFGFYKYMEDEYSYNETENNTFIENESNTNETESEVDTSSISIDSSNSNNNIPTVQGKYPQSSTTQLNPNELTNISLEELQIMRNEIYGRHGYIFKEGGEMNEYFSKQNWYNPQFSNVDSKLTLIEKSNIDLILNEEKVKEFVKQQNTNQTKYNVEEKDLSHYSNIISTTLKYIEEENLEGVLSCFSKNIKIFLLSVSPDYSTIRKFYSKSFNSIPWSNKYFIKKIIQVDEKIFDVIWDEELIYDDNNIPSHKILSLTTRFVFDSNDKIIELYRIEKK